MIRSPILNSVIPVVLVFPFLVLDKTIPVILIFFSCIVLNFLFNKNLIVLECRSQAMTFFLILISIIISLNLNINSYNQSKHIIIEKREVLLKAICIENPQVLNKRDNVVSYIFKAKIINSPLIFRKYVGSNVQCIIEKNHVIQYIKKDNIFSINGTIKSNLKSGFENNIPLIIIDKLHISKNVSNVYSNILISSRLGFINKILSCVDLDNEVKGFLFAFMTGNKSFLSQKQIDVFRRTGTIHLFAVSGLHIGLLFLIIKFFLVTFIWSPKLLVVLSVLLLALYVNFVGNPPSAVRALVMIIFWQGSKLVNRKTNPLSSLAWAFIIIVSIDPREFFTVGFQLSFAVVLSMIWLLRGFSYGKDIFFSFKDFCLSSLVVSYACFWGSFLILIASFKVIVPVSMITNPVVVPFTLPTMLLCVVFVIILFCFGFEIDRIIEYPYECIWFITNTIESMNYGYYTTSLDLNIYTVSLYTIFLTLTINKWISFASKMVVLAIINLFGILLGCVI
tara:strand:- start:6703 stop:8223 length:1521 start_codon:yes stop_codon:yes gene_type:complete